MRGLLTELDIAEEDHEPLTVDRLHDVVKTQGDRLVLLEQQNRRLQERLQVCFEELSTVQSRRPVSDTISIVIR